MKGRLASSASSSRACPTYEKGMRLEIKWTRRLQHKSHVIHCWGAISRLRLSGFIFLFYDEMGQEVSYLIRSLNVMNNRIMRVLQGRAGGEQEMASEDLSRGCSQCQDTHRDVLPRLKDKPWPEQPSWCMQAHRVTEPCLFCILALHLLCCLQRACPCANSMSFLRHLAIPPFGCWFFLTSLLKEDFHGFFLEDISLFR